MQAEGRADAQQEASQLKKKAASLEADLQQQRGTVVQVLTAKQAAEDAAAASAAALRAAEARAKQYRGDSSALLSNYDSWVAGLLAKTSVSGSGGGASPPPPLAAATTGRNSGAAGMLSLSGGTQAGTLQSPGQEGGRPPSASGLSPRPGKLQSANEPRADDDERYERVAALLESRGVGAAAAGASLACALSGKAAAAAPSPSVSLSAAGRLSALQQQLE